MYIGLPSLGLRASKNPFSLAVFLAAQAANTAAWFDPNDLTTMWQDNRGQAVAAVGQPVGLWIDKSQGAVLTRVSTWDFSSGTGITPGAGAAVTGGKLVFTASSATTTTTYAPTAGKLYKITYTISGYSGTGTLTMQLGVVNGTARSSNGTFVDYIPLATSVTTLRFAAAASFSGSLDDVLVDEIAGSHVNASGTARPTLQAGASGYNKVVFDGVDDTLTGSTTAGLYTSLAGINYICICAAKSGASVQSLFSTSNSSVNYHRIQGFSGRISSSYRSPAVAAGAAQLASSPLSTVTDNVTYVFDSQVTTNATIDVGVNATTTSAAVLTDIVGTCYFIIGNAAVPMDFYGAMSVISAVSASDRAGLQRTFATYGGVTY